MATTRMHRLHPLNAYIRASEWLARLTARRRAPHIALILICVFGVGARSFHLGTPAYAGHGKGYVFDESYYVAAAHVIGGKPAVPGEVYSRAAPAGNDPNGEHPQLGKVIIAGGIVLFGDNAFGWRISAVLFGLAAILLMYWLVRCAGGSQWLSVGAAGLASADNLWVVSSRIAVLDIYLVPFMLAGVALYLRRRPVMAGAAIGIGGTVKEFAAYALLILILLEAMRALSALWERRNNPEIPSLRAAWRPILRRAMTPVALLVVAAVVYFSALSVLDALVHPYNNHRRVDRNESALCGHLWLWRGGCNHFAFMSRYAASIRDTGSPHGIAAAPQVFWLDHKVINYFKVETSVLSRGRVVSKFAVIWFRGQISRVLLFTSWIAIVLNLWWALRRRDDASFLVLAWILGTWLPVELLHLVENRTTYLYYMVVVMPGIYLAVARLLALRRIPRVLVLGWVGAFLGDFASLYPFRTFSGH